jgi:two-component system response regulator DevR
VWLPVFLFDSEAIPEIFKSERQQADMGKTRIMIVDDHEVVRMGMRLLFEMEDDFVVVGEASNGLEALTKVAVLGPQLILMDVRMEKSGGIESCREIKNLYPQILILMLTSYTDDEAVIDSVMAGASGYLLKNLSRAELLRSVRMVASGQTLLDVATAQQTIQRLTQASGPGGSLTEREREVLTLVARGQTNKQIAEELSVSEKTARNHVSHILEKLDLNRRSEAAAYAVEHRLVPPKMPPASQSQTGERSGS